MKTKILATLTVFLLVSISQAQVINYLESVSGDLSGNGAAPTFLNFGVGQNTVTGTMGRPPGAGIDRDIFTFTIHPGDVVSALTVLAYQPLAASTSVGSFLAISGSNTINLTNPSTHLSNILVGTTGEILPLLAAGSYSDTLGTQPPTLGLTEPLIAGDYTIWFQELSTPVSYSLGITVTAVPESSTYALVGAGALLLCCMVRRIRRTPATI